MTFLKILISLHMIVVVNYRQIKLNVVCIWAYVNLKMFHISFWIHSEWPHNCHCLFLCPSKSYFYCYIVPLKFSASMLWFFFLTWHTAEGFVEVYTAFVLPKHWNSLWSPEYCSFICFWNTFYNRGSSFTRFQIRGDCIWTLLLYFLDTDHCFFTEVCLHCIEGWWWWRR